MSKIIDRDTLDIDGATQCRDHFADIDRVAFELGSATKGRCRRHLSNQCRRSHLTGSHAIDGIVDKEGGNFLAAGSRMDDLGRADGGQVTISLVRKDHVIRMDPLDSRSDSRSAAMGGLDHVTGEIFVVVVGAADR